MESKLKEVSNKNKTINQSKLSKILTAAVLAVAAVVNSGCELYSGYSRSYDSPFSSGPGIVLWRSCCSSRNPCARHDRSPTRSLYPFGYPYSSPRTGTFNYGYQGYNSHRYHNHCSPFGCW